MVDSVMFLSALVRTALTKPNFVSDYNLSEMDLEGRTARFEKMQETSDLLNNLLADYDSALRPNHFSRSPTMVIIDIEVRSMGPISELDSSYSMDCYFRQVWVDPRLTFFHTNLTTLSLGMSMLDKIWKPDTFFWNGKRSYLHKLTTPNKLVRLMKNGTVLFSSRLTIKSKCDMELHSFPLDKQKCKLRIGSFAYRDDEIIYKWNKRNGGLKADNITLSQFSLTNTFTDQATVTDRGGSFSVLEAFFVLQRHGGYFVINFYVPATMVVLLSWVAFWINREATADRVALGKINQTFGVTSILTMTFLALDARSDLPRVTYPTALDIYILICYTYLLLCIIEFAIVHSYTKYRTGDPEMYAYEIRKLLGPKSRRNSKPHTCILPSSGINSSHNSTMYLTLRGSYAKWKNCAACEERDNKEIDLIKWAKTSRNGSPEEIEDFYEVGMNSISKIDRGARAVFPLTFVIVCYLYWQMYLNE